MKCFERLVSQPIRDCLPPSFDPHQFAYRANRSTEDAIAITLHRALSHLENRKSYFADDTTVVGLISDGDEMAYREIEKLDRDKTLKELKEFKPGNPKVERVRILLHGPVGAGKSSIINSINNIFQGHITSEALADATGGHSFTKTYKTHYTRDPSNPTYKYAFVFNDTMGLEVDKDKGMPPEDILLALKGRVKEGYTFNPVSPLSENGPYYNKDPSLGDKVHCLVTVLPIDTLSLMPKEFFSKLRKIRLNASDMGIPQVVILTKVDEACQMVKKDIKKVYTSKYIKKQMETCNAQLGIPMNCIFPVKNYHKEIYVNNEIDELLLKALKHMINFANDYVMAVADKAH
ncbi:interferon-induced protein 44-like [Megalops cyprinoides]|uniref:interferon-induced protein 44-like n=1 Tax=Megalops cyprinoides TaxID=118141 RepID=UPI0018651475|nr:interferon-induced protein 44-like [Megalops cyprinoides]